MKRENMDERSVVLLDELEALLSNPRAEEIMANDWLHDGSLRVPSLDLVLYVALRTLAGYGIKIDASKQDRNGFITLLVDQLRGESSEERMTSIPRILRRLDCFKYQHTGKKGVSDPHVHEWLPVLCPYLYPEGPKGDADAVSVAAGERMIARWVFETMMHRALFTLDLKRLQSFAVAAKIIFQGESLQPTVENRVMGEILRCLPYLNEKLGRLPSRSELQFFIRQLAALNGKAEFPQRQNPWTDAFDAIGYSAKRREIRIDEDLIVKLAREASVFTG